MIGPWENLQVLKTLVALDVRPGKFGSVQPQHFSDMMMMLMTVLVVLVVIMMELMMVTVVVVVAMTRLVELNGRPSKFGALQPQHFSDLDNIELGTWERLLGNLGKA